MKSQYQLKKEKEIEKKTISLYKQGLTMREVGKIIGKSRTFVWRIMRNVDKVPK